MTLQNTAAVLRLIILLTVVLRPAAGHAQRVEEFSPAPLHMVRNDSQPSPSLTLYGRPRVGLVLSGGGARGLAQIGVIKALERAGIPVDAIVGNSLGSVVGGLYAAGYTVAQIESIAINTNWAELLSFSEETQRRDLFIGQKQLQQSGYLVIRFDGLEPIIPSSISGGQRLTNFFSYLTLQALYHPNPGFDDLKIPFRATATDLLTGRRIIMDSGSISEAMRASVTVPLLYSPLERDSMILVDGGLTSNIPADVARLMGCDIVIVVNSTSSLRKADQLTAPWEIADQIMTIMMQKSNSEELALADVVITPETGERIVSDFSDIASLIAAGERTAAKSIDRIRALLRGSSSGAGTGRRTADGTRTEVWFEGDPLSPGVEEEIRSFIAGEGGSGSNLRDFLHRVASRTGLAGLRVEFPDTVDGTRRVIVRPIRPGIIRSMKVDGNLCISTEEIVKSLSMFQGRESSSGTMRELRESLLRLYRERGYSLARVDSLSSDSGSGTLSLYINEGTIAQIKYQGNERTRDYVIRREIPFDEGDIFNIEKASRALVNIKSTGLFEYVLMDVRYEHHRPVIIFKVKEKSSELVRLGLHADNEHDIVAAVSLRDANFRGAWEDVGITGRYGYRDRMAMADYTINRIFHSYFTFSLKGYYRSRDVFTYRDDPVSGPRRWERLEDGKYRENKYGLALVFGSHFERFGDVTAEVRHERHEINAISGQGYSPEQYQFFSVKLQSVIDTEDKSSFPTSGTQIGVSYEIASKRLGGDVGFGKLLATYESYFSLGSTHVIRPRITFGFADQTLPIAEQFSLGGMNSFLGLREDDSRGRQLFLVNTEYRFRFPYKLIFESYLKLRYDLGTISLVPQQLKFANFRHGLGVELSLDTPIGPTSVGVGQSFYYRQDLADSPMSVGPVLVYFSIGPTF